MQKRKIAYQKEGIKSYLRGLDYDTNYIFDLVENNDVDTLRYRFNIPDEWVNRYWYKALGM